MIEVIGSGLIFAGWSIGAIIAGLVVLLEAALIVFHACKVFLRFAFRELVVWYLDNKPPRRRNYGVKKS